MSIDLLAVSIDLLAVSIDLLAVSIDFVCAVTYTPVSMAEGEEEIPPLTPVQLAWIDKLIVMRSEPPRESPSTSTSSGSDRPGPSGLLTTAASASGEPVCH